jgi:hypothetical protein
MRKKKLALTAGIILLLSSGGIGAEKPGGELDKLPQISKDPNSLIAMTRNLYVGANVDRVIEAQDPNDIPELVAITFQELLSTNFMVRVDALVDEIERSTPHVIGLQEISLIRYQTPGDAVYGGTTPAEYVLFSYLDILMQTLAARELNYYVVGSIQNADVEVPMVVSLSPLAFDDVRVTDFDVLLARSDVQAGNVVEKNYQSFLAIPGTPIVIPRGYVAADITAGHKTYRVLNTHLEPFTLPGAPNFKLEQAMEMIADLQGETLPTILLGDFNTGPGELVYEVIKGYGFVDAWTRNQVQPPFPGFTSGHDSDLRNTVVDLDHRIDLILVRSNVGVNGVHNIGPVFSWVVGDELDDRVMIEYPAGIYSLIWPSDHAGVIALLRIPVLGYSK